MITELYKLKLTAWQQKKNKNKKKKAICTIIIEENLLQSVVEKYESVLRPKTVQLQQTETTC